MEGAAQELVERSRRRDAEAFAALIRQYERVALAVAYAVVRDATAAGDVVQDAFLRAWERLADLREPERFGTWLCGIVRNLAVDSVRRRGTRERHAIDDSAGELRSTQDPVAELSRRERDQRLAEAVGSLDEVTRSVVVLRYYDNMPSKRIGELLELTPAAVDMRLSRARAQLRQLLSDQVMEGSEAQGQR